ncbi:extracellular solute-binding protein [Paenibacillus yanchengensis]|uniref:Extracellular solute-binding protein n=1 Tax=Paenibacillus yanchengensis TaxID=2035833 RepID=A0ABW4YGU9_9BACL
MLAKIRSAVCLLLVLVLLFPLIHSEVNAEKNLSIESDSSTLDGDGQLQFEKSEEPYFHERLEEWNVKGSEHHANTVTLPAVDYTSVSENSKLKVTTEDGRENVLEWRLDNEEWIEYEFDIADAGLYQITMSYRPTTDENRRRPILLNVTIDGENQFIESRSITLDRRWQDPQSTGVDAAGNQVRPMTKDVSGWITTELRDSGGAYVSPLLWKLDKGKHVIRFQSSEPMFIDTITLEAPKSRDDYNSYLQAQPKIDAAAQLKQQPIEIEAEASDWKSDSSISLRYDRDIESTPYKRGKITYNTIDATRWSTGNREISWSFDVPESGYYKFALRAKQSVSSNRSSFRTIRINGEIPFREMEAYKIPFASGWQGLQIKNEEGEAYKFYLEKGRNTITMRVTYAPLKESVTEMEKLVAKLMKLSTDLKALTGGSEDKNRTWKINEELPGFTDDLQAVMDKLIYLEQEVKGINGKTDSVTQGIGTVVKDLESMMSTPNEIPYKLDRFVSLQGKVADLLQQLKNQPLSLDRLYVIPAEEDVPKITANFFEKVEGSLVNFFYSFQSDGKISSLDKDVLNVWVLRGRDYVNLLQEIVDEQFTPQTGIKVKVNLLADTNLLVLMNAAGKAPDVALGLPQAIPFDYAVRNALYDFTTFSDFDEIFERFAPGSWLPFFYNEGYYAVPETQSFSMLYYRKDILKQHGLEVPNTWQDVYDMLPVLQQNNLNMMPPQHIPFFYQNNAEYFEVDGMKTGLNSESGYQAFKEWTDMFNVYAIDRQVASFYQSFRSGTVPIGIADFSMYIQLMVAAPELNGYWGIAPIPGMVQEDGTVARWMGGDMQGSVMFKSTKKAEQGWEFLKWWSSGEVQERYGNDLETLNGLTFRWNTANIDAFTRLPWKKEDMESILEQWRWYKEIPNVPGSYYLERELQNAWNRTVIDGMNYRSSLEQSIREIEREMLRKMAEFGHLDSKGQLIKSLNLPRVTEPWKGVERYVRD